MISDWLAPSPAALATIIGPLAKALQGSGDVGEATLHQHLADGTAQLPRLRKLLHELSN